MSTKRLCVLCLLAMLALMLGCKPSLVTNENFLNYADQTIVRGDRDYALSTRDVFEALWQTQIQPRGGTVPTDELRVFTDSLLMDTLCGFVTDDDVRLEDYYHDYWSYRQRYYDFLARAYVGSQVLSQIEVDSQVIIDHYSSHPERYSVPEQVLLYHILVSPRWFRTGEDSTYYNSLDSATFATAVRDYAFELHAKLDSGQAFDEVARDFSHDKLSSREGGFVGWTERDKYLAPFDSIAFQLQPGEYSQPYQDKDGWHLIYITDRLDEGLPPIERPETFAIARQGYLSEETSKLNSAVIDSLRQAAVIEYNEPVLDEDVFKAEDSVWAAVINGVDTVDFKLLRNLEMMYRRGYKVRNTTADIKKKMVQSLADRYLFVQLAKHLKIDTLPEVRAEEYRLRHETSKAIVLRERYDPTWKPSDSVLSQYYQDHYREYVPEKPLTLQQIIVKDSILAAFIYDQATSGVDFMTLATEYNLGEASVRAELADLGEVGPNDINSAVYSLAMNTHLGDVTDPLKTEQGYHIVKVLERRPVIPESRARGGILTKLQAEYREAEVKRFTDELMARYHFEYVGELPAIHLKPLRYRMDTTL